MGDTQNCDSPNDVKPIPVVNMASVASARDGLKYEDDEKIL